MCHHKYYTIFDKECLLKYLLLGYKQNVIAELLGKHPSSVSREIKRGTDKNGEYSLVLSEKRSKKEMSKRGRKRKLAENPELKNLIKDKIKNLQWSPEELADRMKLENYKDTVSVSTIYREIYKRTFDDPGTRKDNKGFNKNLRRKGTPYRNRSKEEKRGKILITNPIETRPKEANERIEIGHFELDSVCGKKSSASILTAVDRKSRFLKAALCPMQKSEYVLKAILKLFKNDTPDKLKSFTPDRGKEFSFHPRITEKLGIPFYFPNAHHPWERGTNERLNSDLREYFPKRKEIKSTDKKLQEIVKKINLRPRKCLGNLTPFEVYYEIKLQLI